MILDTIDMNAVQESVMTDYEGTLDALAQIHNEAQNEYEDVLEEGAYYEDEVGNTYVVENGQLYLVENPVPSTRQYVGHLQQQVDSLTRNISDMKAAHAQDLKKAVGAATAKGKEAAKGMVRSAITGQNKKAAVAVQKAGEAGLTKGMAQGLRKGTIRGAAGMAALGAAAYGGHKLYKKLKANKATSKNEAYLDADGQPLQEGIVYEDSLGEQFMVENGILYRV